MSKIYTRTGDKGKTSLLGGQRVEKNNIRVETYGTVDELNSLIGITIVHIHEQQTKHILIEIQDDLLNLGSSLANPHNPPLSYLSKRVRLIEKVIDKLTEKLPELHNFILPGGSLAGAHLHHCRTVCRRLERHLIGLSQHEQIDDRIIVYINRLSDLLFTLARYINFLNQQSEALWSSTTKN